MEDGWIKVWRKIKINPIFKNDSLLKCWIYCLIEATHKEFEIMIDGKIIKLTPGQFVSGRNKANKELGWKGKKFDRKMKFLETYGFLTRQVTRHFTLNSIINWDIYQHNENESDQLSDQSMTNDRPMPDHSVTTYKNNKNVKKEKKILTDDQFLSSLKEKFTWVDFDAEIARMDAWLLANPKRQKTRRFITNWFIRKERPLQPANAPPTDPMDRRMWEIEQARKKDGYIEPT